MSIVSIAPEPGSRWDLPWSNERQALRSHIRPQSAQTRTDMEDMPHWEPLAGGGGPAFRDQVAPCRGRESTLGQGGHDLLLGCCRAKSAASELGRSDKLVRRFLEWPAARMSGEVLATRAAPSPRRGEDARTMTYGRERLQSHILVPWGRGRKSLAELVRGECGKAPSSGTSRRGPLVRPVSPKASLRLDGPPSPQGEKGAAATRGTPLRPPSLA
jgi:hypothetical protein